MGGAVSELRHSIHAHVVIAQHYPLFLEPFLVVVQFFLRTAETGEGADPDRPVDEIPMDIVITDKRIFAEASTEIELLVENAQVMRTLLRGIQTYRQLTLAPDLDPLRRWYDPPWRKDNKPMPRFLDIAASDVPRFQVAVLRSVSKDTQFDQCVYSRMELLVKSVIRRWTLCVNCLTGSFSL